MAKKQTARTITILISFLFIAAGMIVPIPSGITRQAAEIVGIFLGVLVLWLFVTIDWPSLLCLLLLALVDDMGFVLKSAFGSPTFAFLILTFVCTYGLSKTGFVRRCAVLFVTNRHSMRGQSYLLISYLLSVLLLGLFMSPTVLFVIYLPIHEELCGLLGLRKGSRLGAALMIGLALTCALASGMTPIAHVFSNMAMGFYESATGTAISYGSYMAFAIPVGIICFAFLIGVLLLMIRHEKRDALTEEDRLALRASVSPFTRREKKIIAIFFLVVCGWVLPSILGVIPLFKQIGRYGTAFPPLVGAVLLFLLTDEGVPLLDFGEAFSKGVGWKAIIMAASTLALGAVMTKSEIGLTAALTEGLGSRLANVPASTLILIFTLWAALQTNFSSNMVTVTVVTATAVPLCLASNGLIDAGAIACIIGLMGSFSFATPPAHPNIALAAASGWTTTREMMVHGFLLMFISVAVTVVIGYPLAAALV